MNLFGNAQKYTESGYITVQLRLTEPEKQTEDFGTASGGSLSLIVKDTGKGMSPEYMKRKLYHPFAQEDTFSSGVGLGLSIV